MEASVIRSEIQSSAELKSRFAFVSAPSRQRDTAHRSIGTGRRRARRRFGYWGEQIGQSARSEWSPFRSAPAEFEPATAGLKQLWKTLSLPVVRRPIAKEQHYDRGFESFPRYQSCDFARQTTIFCDLVRSMVWRARTCVPSVGLILRVAPLRGQGF